MRRCYTHTLSAIVAANTVTLRQDDLAFQLEQLGLELGQLVVALLHDQRHVGEGAPIGGDLAQLLGALFDFQLFAYFAPNRLLDLLQPIRQQVLRHIVRQAVLVAQLIQHRMLDVVTLLGGANQNNKNVSITSGHWITKASKRKVRILYCLSAKSSQGTEWSTQRLFGL